MIDLSDTHDDDDSLDHHRPSITDLPQFYTHFMGVASPYAVQLYAALLDIATDQSYDWHCWVIYTSIRKLRPSTKMTRPRIIRALEELSSYNAIVDLDIKRDGSVALNIQLFDKWKSAQECRNLRESRSADVYVLQCGDEYKIGFSYQMERRVKDIGRKLPSCWSVVHSISTEEGAGLEKFWHDRFRPLRVKSPGKKEWFNLGEPELSWLKYAHHIDYPPAKAKLELQFFAYIRRSYPRSIASTRWNLSQKEYDYCDRISTEIWG